MFFRRQSDPKTADAAGPCCDKFWWQVHAAAAAFGLRIGYSRGDVEFAFRRLARTAHPDVGGTREGFQLLTAQRDLLLSQAADPKLQIFSP